MSANDLENKFRGYNWNCMLKEFPKEKFFDDTTLLIRGIRTFSNKFSPKINYGFFQNLFKNEYYKRSKEDAVNFIFNSELVKNEEEAIDFIKTFKNRNINYLMTGSRTGEYFKLIEFKNVDGMPIYLTDVGKCYFDSPMD